ncbi:Latrophilin Cirl, partial [Fragariocoptes setiger]
MRKKNNSQEEEEENLLIMSHKSNTESEFECQSKRFVLSQQRGLQQSYCQKMHEKVHRRRCDNQKKSTDCSIVANQNDITTKIIIMSDINRLTSQRIDDDEMSTSPVYRRSRPQHKQQQQEYVPQEKKVSKCPIVVDSTTTTKSLRSRFHEPMFLNMRMPTLSLLFSQMLLLILILEIPLQSSAIAAANAPQLKHTTALNNRPPPNAKGHIHYKTTYACEGNSLELTCDDSKSIHLVRANYGRFSLTICNDAGNPTFSVNCMSFRSYLLMQD